MKTKPTLRNKRPANSPSNHLPEGWVEKELGKLFEFKNGINAGKESYGQGVKFINVMEVIYNDSITPNIIPGTVQISDKQKEIYLVKDGDVLFNRTSETTDEIGLTAVYYGKDEVVFGGFVIRGRPLDNALNNDFKKYCFRSKTVRDQIIKSGQGAVRTNVGQGDLEKVKVLLPPLPEQHAIASCLGTWDKAIEKTQQLITQKQLRKKWLMQMLLTGKKRLKGFEKTKWHLKSLEEVAEFENGKAHENVIDEDGKYIVINSKFISTEGSVFKCSNENLSPLFRHDIAMVMSDIPNGKALAKCFYVNENDKYTLNQRICAIRVFESTDSRFLFFMLNRNTHYLSFNNGVGQTNLRKEEVLECPLFIPEKEEQTAIATVLSAADKEILLLNQKLEKLKEQKKGLMQVLLTGRVRLKIKM